MNALDLTYKKIKYNLNKTCFFLSLSCFVMVFTLVNLLFFGFYAESFLPSTRTVIAWIAIFCPFAASVILFYFLRKKFITRLNIMQNIGDNYHCQRKLIGSYFSETLLAENVDDVKSLIDKKLQNVEAVKNPSIKVFPNKVLLLAVSVTALAAFLLTVKSEIIENFTLSLSSRSKSVHLKVIDFGSSTKTLFSDRPTEIHLTLNRPSHDQPYLTIDKEKIEFNKTSEKSFFVSIPSMKGKDKVTMSVSAENLKTAPLDYKVEPVNPLVIDSITELNLEGRKFAEHYQNSHITANAGHKLKINFLMLSPSLKNFGVMSNSIGEIPILKTGKKSYFATINIQHEDSIHFFWKYKNEKIDKKQIAEIAIKNNTAPTVSLKLNSHVWNDKNPFDINCRILANDDKAVSRVFLILTDLKSLKVIKEVNIKSPHKTVLINNAGFKYDEIKSSGSRTLFLAAVAFDNSAFPKYSFTKFQHIFLPRRSSPLKVQQIFNVNSFEDYQKFQKLLAMEDKKLLDQQGNNKVKNDNSEDASANAKGDENPDLDKMKQLQLADTLEQLKNNEKNLAADEKSLQEDPENGKNLNDLANNENLANQLEGLEELAQNDLDQSEVNSDVTDDDLSDLDELSKEDDMGECEDCEECQECEQEEDPEKKGECENCKNCSKCKGKKKGGKRKLIASETSNKGSRPKERMSTDAIKDQQVEVSRDEKKLDDPKMRMGTKIGSSDNQLKSTKNGNLDVDNRRLAASKDKQAFTPGGNNEAVNSGNSSDTVAKQNEIKQTDDTTIEKSITEYEEILKKIDLKDRQQVEEYYRRLKDLTK